MKPLLLAVLLAAGASAETNRQALERRAGDIWDAAHAKDPARKTTPERRALFARVEALTKVGSVRPKPVAAALGLAAAFEKTDETEYTSFYEAHPSSGSAITFVDLRAGRGTSKTGLVVLDVDPRLDVEPQDVIARFGDRFGVQGPGVDAPAGAPYDYVYRLPGGKLFFGLKPGPKHVLVRVGWDTDKDD